MENKYQSNYKQVTTANDQLVTICQHTCIQYVLTTVDLFASEHFQVMNLKQKRI